MAKERFPNTICLLLIFFSSHDLYKGINLSVQLMLASLSICICVPYPVY